MIPLAAGALVAALGACGGSGEDTGPASATSPPTPSTPTTPTTPTPEPEDIDADGYTDEVDCDDLDPTSYPGAPEAWDGADNDCDGRVDATGTFVGSVACTASAIIDGTPHAVDLVCPAELERFGEATIDFTIRCTADPGDETARRVLGPELVVTPIDNAAVTAGAWAGDALFASSAGWSADGVGSATWPTMDDLEISLTLSTLFLDVWVGGELTFEP